MSSFGSVNVAEVKHPADCITCCTLLRNHLIKWLRKIQMVFDLCSKEFCAYSCFYKLSL